VRATVAALCAAYEELAAAPIDALTTSELIGALDELETLTCALPAQRHRLLARLQAETTATDMGAKSWRDVLATRWRLSPGEAARRLEETAALAPRCTLTGAPLEPVLACTAAAQAHGSINREHIKVVREAMGRIPAVVDSATRAQIEVDLVRTAIGVGPKELKDNAERILLLLDQDGPEPDDTERARRRGLSTGPPGTRQDDPVAGQSDARSRGDLRGDIRQVGRAGDVQPRRRAPLCVGDPDTGPDR
jgi:Domain of unknown function (DUF222)